MRFGLEENIINKLIEVFETNPKVNKAFIFGSRAKGNYKEGSDIDIAIKGQDLNFDDTLSLLRKLDELELTYEIDLINYHTIKEPDLINHIDRVGIELYSRWKQFRLGDIADITSSKRIFFSDYVTSGIPFYRSKEIIEKAQSDNISTDLFITKEKFYEIKDKYGAPQNGDILISAVGERAGIPYCVNNDGDFYFKDGNIIWFRNFNSEISSNFLVYYFNSSIGQQRLESTMIGSAQKALTIIGLKNLEVAFPPLYEQNAITSILSSLDYKIDLLNRQNKTLEQLAETLFRQWFVEEAEDDWEEKNLTEIADYLNGLALQKFPAKTDYLPVIKIREMKQGISENSDKCSRDIPTQYIIQDGDVLFSWSGSLEVVLWTGGEGALNQHLFKVSSKEYPKWFYYLATKHHLNNFKTIAESKSTTMGHIQREHLKQAIISIPPKVVFDEYDLRIAPLINKQIENNFQIRTLTKTRDNLLPKLMSGEVKVKL